MTTEEQPQDTALRSMKGGVFAPRTKEQSTTQTSGTPRDFLTAVETQFEVKIGFDLACTTADCVAFSNVNQIPCDENGVYDPAGEHFIGGRTAHGYFYDQGVNALEQDWSTIEQPVAFLNPEFSHLAPWVRELLKTDALRGATGKGPRCFALLPAGTGCNWFKEYVAGTATGIYFLSPRIKFIDPATGKPFQVAEKKKGKLTGKMKDAAINRDCMLLDYNSAPPGQPQPERVLACWNWKTGEMVKL